MQKILAIDAGGTSTRAVIVDLSGRCLGYGLAGGGNPVSAGIDSAIDSLATATEQAIETAAEGPVSFSSALMAMAGASAATSVAQISERFKKLGLTGELVIESDLLGTFFSGTFHPQGYALVAGTGAVAARIRDGQLDAVADGMGWLLGDTGSGYWIGHQVARAVVAALDGRAPVTGLTGLLLASLQLEETPERVDGRPLVLQPLIRLLYSLQPIELSRFAPLAFQAQDDHVARGILAAAASALAGTLAAVRDPVVDGPVVLGGSVLSSGMLTGATPLAASLKAALGNAELIPVRDGVVGAAVLGLLRAGVPVDREVFCRIGQSVTPLR